MTFKKYKWQQLHLSNFNVSALSGIAIKMLAMFIGLLSSVLLARVLGVENYGVYTFLITAIQLAVILALFGTPTLITREVSSALHRSDYIAISELVNWSRVVSLALSLLLIVLIFPIMKYWSIVKDQDIALYTLLFILLLIPIDALNRQNAHIAQASQKIVAFNILSSLTTSTVFAIILFLAFLLQPELLRLDFVVLALLFSSVVTLIVGYRVNNPLYRKIALSSIKDFAYSRWGKAAIPFLLISGMLIFNSRIDILMLGFMSSVEDVGIYRVAQRGSELMLVGITSVDAVIIPIAVRLLSKKNLNSLRPIMLRGALFLLLFTVPLLLTYYVFGYEIIRYVFGDAYTDAFIPLMILSLGYFIMGVLGRGGVILSMDYHEKTTAKLVLFSMLLNVVLNVILIPLYGVNGAAIATAIAVITRSILEAILVYKIVGVNVTVFSLPYFCKSK